LGIRFIHSLPYRPLRLTFRAKRWCKTELRCRREPRLSVQENAPILGSALPFVIRLFTAHEDVKSVEVANGRLLTQDPSEELTRAIWIFEYEKVPLSFLPISPCLEQPEVVCKIAQYMLAFCAAGLSLVMSVGT